MKMNYLPYLIKDLIFKENILKLIILFLKNRFLVNIDLIVV